MEVMAVLEKDTATLLRLWDKDFVVNAPVNKVVFASTTTFGQTSPSEDYGLFFARCRRGYSKRECCILHGQ